MGQPNVKTGDWNHDQDVLIFYKEVCTVLLLSAWTGNHCFGLVLRSVVAFSMSMRRPSSAASRPLPYIIADLLVCWPTQTAIRTPPTSTFTGCTFHRPGPPTTSTARVRPMATSATSMRSPRRTPRAHSGTRGHPHRDQASALQIASGMVGALIVEDTAMSPEPRTRRDDGGRASAGVPRSLALERILGLDL